MEIDDIPKVESCLSEMEESIRRIQQQVRSLGELKDRLSTTCREDPELMEVLRREDRYVRKLRSIVEDFALSRMVRRRLPSVESRIQRREDNRTRENKAVHKQASEVHDSLEELLHKFLQ